ncbi:MAG: hypothetical protein AAF975_07215 [Spirochaetota bacterium]
MKILSIIVGITITFLSYTLLALYANGFSPLTVQDFNPKELIEGFAFGLAFGWGIPEIIAYILAIFFILGIPIILGIGSGIGSYYALRRITQIIRPHTKQN